MLISALVKNMEGAKEQDTSVGTHVGILCSLCQLHLIILNTDDIYYSSVTCAANIGFAPMYVLLYLVSDF